MRALWRGWRRLGQAFGDFQARWLMTVLYFTLVALFAPFIRLFSDRLQLRRVQGSSAFSPRPETPASLDAARRQF